MSNRISTVDRTWAEAGPPGFVCRVVKFQPLPMVELGAHLEELAQGNLSCPLHYHLVEEEHFFVLSGTLTVRELPPDGDTCREYELHAGELVAWMPGTRIAHQISNRGAEPARFFAVSDQRETEICVYPESGKTMLGGAGVGLFPAPADVAQALAEARARAAARPVVRLADADRPAHVVGPGRVPERSLGGAFGRPLSRAAGARMVFVNQDRLPPGSRSSELHAHLGDEELIYVLSGHPTLRQVRGRREGRVPVFDAPEERIRLDPGDVVHWAAGDLVAHQLLNEADDDACLLVVGTDHRHDICLYPETGEVRAGLLDRRARFLPTDYWAGELSS